MTDAPIGIFDSGFGGLTVARSVLDQLPHESVVYFGDTARAPYGPRPIAETRRYALECLDRLVDHGVKVLVIACNTASAAVLHDARERYDLPVPLTVLESPFREITRPVVDYVKDIRRESPREIVVVFVPQYVVGHWWENVLHNQSALRLRARLQFQPGVMITSVPWQLESSLDRGNKLDGNGNGNGNGPAPGDLRRGLTDEVEQTPYG